MKSEYVKNLERKNYLFTFVVSLWSHGYLLKDVLGDGFMHSVFTYCDDTGVLYHTPEDIKSVEKTILNLINKNSPLLHEWYSKAKELNLKSDKLIYDAEKINFNDGVFFENDLSHFIDTFLYSTVIPYWVLATMDTQIKNGKNMDVSRAVLDKYEELRGQTRYPQLMSARIDKYISELSKKSGVDVKLLGLL